MDVLTAMEPLARRAKPCPTLTESCRNASSSDGGDSPSDVPVTYVEAATFILNRDGVAGLLWRGLAAKILCNGLSSVLFSVIWKSMMDRMEPKRKEKV